MGEGILNGSYVWITVVVVDPTIGLPLASLVL